jgi:hypothetical protein
MSIPLCICIGFLPKSRSRPILVQQSTMAEALWVIGASDQVLGKITGNKDKPDSFCTGALKYEVAL